jgi:hypothetical protein
MSLALGHWHAPRSCIRRSRGCDEGRNVRYLRVLRAHQDRPALRLQQAKGYLKRPKRRCRALSVDVSCAEFNAGQPVGVEVGVRRG